MALQCIEKGENTVEKDVGEESDHVAQTGQSTLGIDLRKAYLEETASSNESECRRGEELVAY